MRFEAFNIQLMRIVYAQAIVVRLFLVSEIEFNIFKK